MGRFNTLVTIPLLDMLCTENSCLTFSMNTLSPTLRTALPPLTLCGKPYNKMNAAALC